MPEGPMSEEHDEDEFPTEFLCPSIYAVTTDDACKMALALRDDFSGTGAATVHELCEKIDTLRTTLASSRAALEEKDAVWCAAILPEGAGVIQRVTTRVNDPKFVAEVEAFRAKAALRKGV